MIPDIEKVVIVRVDGDHLNFYIHLADNVLSGYKVNLTIRDGSNTETFSTDGTSIIGAVNISSNRFGFTVNYSYGVDFDGNDVVVSNSITKNGIDFNSFPTVTYLDLSKHFTYNYGEKDNYVRVNGLDILRKTFMSYGLLVRIDDNIPIIDDTIDYCEFDRNSRKSIYIFRNDEDVEELGIGLFRYDFNSIDDSLIKDRVDWIYGVSKDVNISGFETISNEEIVEIFDRIKFEKEFVLTRSLYDKYKWVAKDARNNILDESNYKVTDMSGNVVEEFVNYEYKDTSFKLDKILDGSYMLVGEVVNYYRLLSRLWEIRVANRVKYVNTNVRGVNVRLEQEYNHCVKMRDYYNNLVVRRLSWN